jgi:hypothetical protein
MLVASVARSPRPRLCSSIPGVTGASRSRWAATLRPSVCGARSTACRAKRAHCRSTGAYSRYLSQVASMISGSASLPRATIARGVGAVTICCRGGRPRARRAAPARRRGPGSRWRRRRRRRRPLSASCHREQFGHALVELGEFEGLALVRGQELRELRGVGRDHLREQRAANRGCACPHTSRRICSEPVPARRRRRYRETKIGEVHARSRMVGGSEPSVHAVAVGATWQS